MFSSNFIMSKKDREDCFVPGCPNKRLSTPNKLFFSLPTAGVVRDQWCNAVGRSAISTDSRSASALYYCCEDHFQLDEDVQDWSHYKTLKQADKKKFALKLKPNVLPRIFLHQLGGRSLTSTPEASITLKKEQSEAVSLNFGNFVEVDVKKVLSQPVERHKLKTEAMEDVKDVKPVIKTEDSQDPLYIPEQSDASVCIQLKVPLSDNVVKTDEFVNIKTEVVHGPFHSEESNSSACAQSNTWNEAEAGECLDIKPNVKDLQESLNSLRQPISANIHYQVNVPVTNNRPETEESVDVKPKIEDLNESCNLSEYSNGEDFQVNASTIFNEAVTEECEDVKPKIKHLHKSTTLSVDNENTYHQSHQCSQDLGNAAEDATVDMSCSFEEPPLLNGRSQKTARTQVSSTPMHQNGQVRTDETCCPDGLNENVSVPPPKEGEWFNADDSDNSSSEQGSEENPDEYFSDETTDDEISAESSEQETDDEYNGYWLYDKFMDELRAELSDEENADEEDVDENGDSFNTNDWCFQFHMNLINKNPKLYLGLNEKQTQILSSFKKFSGLPTIYFLVVLRMVHAGGSIEDLSVFFSCSKNTITKVLTQTCPIAAAYFQRFIFWPDRDTIEANFPPVFRSDFSQVRCIIDCFEMRIKKPRNEAQQLQTFSKRYNCHTLKYLVSWTPDGFFNFVSQGYGGRSTRAQILKDCGFLEKLEPGNHIMVRRGFKRVESLLNEKQVFLVRPPRDISAFVAVKREIKRKKIIAPDLSVYLERVLERLEKECLFLRNCSNYRRLSNFADQAVIIACAMSNLRAPYVTVI